ncbi:MAG TPA: hypothetical protein VIC85_07725, partial [Ktedonobacterales bacterium]
GKMGRGGALGEPQLAATRVVKRGGALKDVANRAWGGSGNGGSGKSRAATGGVARRHAAPVG